VIATSVNDAEQKQVRRWIEAKFGGTAEWREVSQYYEGDFYSLTTYRTANDVWMAWQFDKSEDGAVVIQAFRRPRICPRCSMKAALSGSNYFLR